ncbi:CBS domain-containing protein [Halobacterium wangiae]|uniref:CBS domain-containing protein n=1 Tax=Halobacterium wangiae TaxID=2902623 RepID=UPI001E5B9461|nr:CBS domain-containing protein [Halobacterium wangiae]
MQVADAMTNEVVTVAAEASLHAAAGRMLTEGVGSVVVTREGNPAGILTEADFVAAGHEHDRPFGEIPVYAAASSPLVTIGPTATLRAAAAKMSEERIKRLPVAEGIDLVGIVTATDLLAAQGDLDAESRRYLREREEWTVD